MIGSVSTFASTCFECRPLPVLVALMSIALTIAGCQAPSASQDDRGSGYRVVATVGMVADIVGQVAGDRARVSGLMGEGVDPHLYKPTASDVGSLETADVIFYCGLLLEGKMQDVLLKVARGGKPVYAVTERIDEAFLLEPEGMEGHPDPHVWMDVEGWMKAVEAVTAALSEYDPDGADAYRANAAAYLSELRQLDTYVHEVIGSIPDRQRVLVTAHDAFNYFGRAYDIEVRGIQGLSTESEAGVRDINELVAYLVERDIGAVFVETSVGQKNVEALIEGAASRGHEVTIGGSLFSDAMGQGGTWQGTYLGMIDHNATTIARSLGGSPPEGGFRQWREAREDAPTTTDGEGQSE